MKYALLVLVFLFTPVFISYAQVGMGIADQGLTIDTEPLFPAPETAVVANLNDYSLPIQAASITWRIDGKTVAGSGNQRSLNFTTKAAGEETVLEAIIELASGGSISTKKIIRPIYLDVIVEPQTRTPAFYLGRSLPSVGSMVNLTALLNGNAFPPNTLLYTWRLNNSVVEGGTIRGGNKISVPTPLGQAALITLDVSRLDGNILARRVIQIPSVSPQLYFYEKSALFGQGTKSLTTINLIGNSVTVQAEPYYLDILTYNTPEFLEWEIDGNTNNNDAKNPYEITLANQGIGGTSRIDLHVRNLTQLLQGTQGGFQINF